MAQQTGISWTDATWNPWHGCKKVSQGCKYCYMFRDKERWKKDPTVVIRSKANFKDPLNWQRQIGAWPLIDSTSFLNMKIFTCSWSDFFIEEADEWRAEAWQIIKDTPEFTYQILTKRPERIAAHLPADWGQGYPNVWLGVTAEDQKTAAQRIPILMDLPAAKRFVSFEPLIEKIDLYPVFKGWTAKHYDRMYPFDWAIIGGESGNDEGKYLYRECSIHWMFDLIFSLDIWLIPIWVKQMGTHISKHLGMKNRHGQDLSEWPDKLQRQEFPRQSPPSNAVVIPLPGKYPVLPTTGITYSKMPELDYHTGTEDGIYKCESCGAPMDADEFTVLGGTCDNCHCA